MIEKLQTPAVDCDKITIARSSLSSEDNKIIFQ